MSKGEGKKKYKSKFTEKEKEEIRKTPLRFAPADFTSMILDAQIRLYAYEIIIRDKLGLDPEELKVLIED